MILLDRTQIHNFTKEPSGTISIRRCLLYFLELYTDLVFLVGIRLVFLGIYQTDTGGKLGRYILV